MAENNNGLEITTAKKNERNENYAHRAKAEQQQHRLNYNSAVCVCLNSVQPNSRQFTFHI